MEAPNETNAAVGSGERWCLGAVLAVAAALRIWHLGSLPFEQDELYTLRDAIDFGASAGEGPGILGRPLYYLLQHVLLAVAPAGPLYLRAPAFLFGVLGVLATWWAGRRMIGPAAGLAAAAFVALSPWHLYHSQFARYWTLLYLLATCAFAVLPAALAGKRGAPVVFVLLSLAAALTHPTFLFALAGAAAGATAVSGTGRVRLPIPSRSALIGVWLPLLAPLAAWYGYVRLLDGGRALRNPGGATAESVVRVIPAMAQWLGPTMVAAAVLGLFVLWGAPGRREREVGRERGPQREAHTADGAARRGIRADAPWGRLVAAMCAGGVLSTLVLLLAAGSRTTVYADYGTAALPLVFLGAGAAAQFAAARAGQPSALAFAALVIAGILPQTLSHMTDGTRFDFRPAHEAIRESRADAPVVAWPIIVHRHYAPDLTVVEADGDPATYELALAESGGFWAISAVRRHGVVPGGRAAEDWIDAHCRREERWESRRLDYRRYAVELAWCARTRGTG